MNSFCSRNVYRDLREVYAYVPKNSKIESFCESVKDLSEKITNYRDIYTAGVRDLDKFFTCPLNKLSLGVDYDKVYILPKSGVMVNSDAWEDLWISSVSKKEDFVACPVTGVSLSLDSSVEHDVLYDMYEVSRCFSIFKIYFENNFPSKDEVDKAFMHMGNMQVDQHIALEECRKVVAKMVEALGKMCNKLLGMKRWFCMGGCCAYVCDHEKRISKIREKEIGYHCSFFGFVRQDKVFDGKKIRLMQEVSLKLYALSVATSKMMMEAKALRLKLNSADEMVRMGFLFTPHNVDAE